MVQLIDGKAVSVTVRKCTAEEIQSLQEEQGITSGLAIILIGEDFAPEVYAKNKGRACEEVGTDFELYRLSASATQQKLEGTIRPPNGRGDVDGILLQLPLPGHPDASQFVGLVRPDKSVGVFHPENIGHIMRGGFVFLPCTPAGITELLRTSGIGPAGQHCVVIGRSSIVGELMAMQMLHADAAVTVCCSKAQNLAGVCREADILVSAVGQAGLITSDTVRSGTAVIDAKMDRNEEGELCGNMDFASVEPVMSYITPVPGGVGPMTVAMLLQNTLKAAKRHSGITG